MAAEPKQPLGPVAWVCLAEVLSMTGFSAYPALLPQLRQEWALNGVQAGFVGGAFFFGYMLAVPFLSSLTDRIDARRVFAASCVLAGAGAMGFALLARGAASAALCQAIIGAGLAGTYMPGLKSLTDRVTGRQQSRTVAFYTATFSIGASASLASAGWLGAHLGWQAAFALLALGPLAAACILLLALSAHPPPAARGRGGWRALREAFAHRDVRRYVLGYAVHCWELFSLRSWIVAFLVYAGYASGPAAGIAAMINLLGLPASVLGNEAAVRLGRVRWIAGVMCAAGVLSWLTALAAPGTGWLTLVLLGAYVACVMADSATLTAGMIAAAPATQRGAAMAVHTFLGFGAGFVSPMVFGATLDAAGGGRLAWVLAFGTLSAGGVAWAAAARLRGEGMAAGSRR
jgi:predicted MFS family arabinose efflux permease